MSTELQQAIQVRRGYATNGKGELRVHLWVYDRQFGLYESLCGTKVSKGVSEASESAKLCASCSRSRRAAHEVGAMP